MIYNDIKTFFLSHSKKTKQEAFTKTFNTSMKSSVNHSNHYNTVKNTLTSESKNR